MSYSKSQLRKHMNKLEGPIRVAFERVVRMAQGRVNMTAIVAAIEANDLNAVLKAAGVNEAMWSQVTEEIRNAYSASGTFVLAADLPKRLALDFDINNTRAEAWLRNNSSTLISGNLVPEQRAAVREILQGGMARGQNPRTTALDIVGRIGKNGRRQGGVLGLNKRQAQFVNNMTDDLLNLNPRYFTRRLRDKRLDSTIKRYFKEGKAVPKKVREKAITSYENRLMKHRADTIARTETLASLNAASDEALQQVVDSGLAPSNAVIRVWRHSFSPNEREGHLAMNGQERKLNEAFINPLTGKTLLRPGDGPASEIINCRCYIEHRVDFAAVEAAA